MKNLPNVIAELVKAQDNFDSKAYSDCFSETAVVYDEGKTYKGKTEIQNWIEKAHEEYQVVMKPLKYIEDGTSSILSAEVSGSFPGSPAVLQYHFILKNNLIDYLKVTG